MKNEYANYIKTSEITFKHAKGMRDITGKEFHPYHEIFLFLGGNAEFISEKLKLRLIPNTLVIIPKETFHQFVVFGDEADYRRCVFNFDYVAELNELISLKMTQICALPAMEEMLAQFTALMVAADNNNTDSLEMKILAKAVFARVIVELTSSAYDAGNVTTLHPLVSAAISYIKIHIQEPIQISDIADYLHISASHLMRIFKNDLHISIYRYISEKKLILANREIEKGLPPTQAAALFGFRDYSGFYKLYKKMFGISPSKKRKKDL